MTFKTIIQCKISMGLLHFVVTNTMFLVIMLTHAVGATHLWHLELLQYPYK